MPEYSFTHNELIIVAEKFLKHNFHCGVHVSETTSTSSESPDAIGWKKYGSKSCLIEVKASRSDFFGDMEKKHRQGPDGMGNWRYYLVPKGMITVEEVPSGWGLLWYDGKKIYKKKDAAYRRLTNNAIKFEKSMLYSELRKFHMLLDGEVLNMSRSGRRVQAIYEAYKLDVLNNLEFENETGNDDENLDTDYHKDFLN
jgi:hypothetical protein